MSWPFKSKIQYYSGTLRVTNPKTLQYYKDSGKYQALIDQGYIYAPGCGRFRSEICTCTKCRKLLTNK